MSTQQGPEPLAPETPATPPIAAEMPGPENIPDTAADPAPDIGALLKRAEDDGSYTYKRCA